MVVLDGRTHLLQLERRQALAGDSVPEIRLQQIYGWPRVRACLSGDAATSAGRRMPCCTLGSRSDVACHARHGDAGIDQSHNRKSANDCKNPTAANTHVRESVVTLDSTMGVWCFCV